MVFLKNHTLKKGLMFVISLFIFQPTFAQAKELSVLALEKLKDQDRMGAVKLLNDEIARLESSSEVSESKTQKIRQLKNMSLRVSGEFLTEEGQRLFELGKSLAQKTPDQAISRLQQALVIEQNSTLILKQMSRIYLQQKDCKKADESAIRAQKLVSFDSASFVLRMQVKECFGTLDLRVLNLGAVKKLIPEKNPFLDMYFARRLFRMGKLEEGKHNLDAIQAEHEDWPDLHYWKWKLDPSEGKIDSDHARKYLKLCKNLSPRLDQKLSRYGQSCLQTEDVAARLKQLVKESSVD